MKRLIFVITSIITLWSCTKNATDTITEKYISEPEGYTKYKPLTVIFDLNQAQKDAKQKDKNILVIFSGYGVIGNLGAEWKLIHKDSVYVSEHYILLALLLDDKRPIYEGSSLTVAQYSENIMKKYFGNIAGLPKYLTLTPELKEIDRYIQYPVDENKFREFLRTD